MGRIRELRRKYEEQKQTEECFTSANKLLNRIMEAKRNGEIQGIFGRLVCYFYHYLNFAEIGKIKFRVIWVPLMLSMILLFQ
jgi:hypothetical protein